jgi:hypothetical protein
MSHIVFAGEKFYFSDDEFDRQSVALEEAANEGRPLFIHLQGEEGESRLLWTPGAPIVLNGWDVE